MKNLEENFIGKYFKQNCGDTLFVVEKTTNKKNNSYLYRCIFQKYPYEILALKYNILRGSVNNPQIEQKEFIDKIWLQNCGDSLKIIQKTNQLKNTHYLFECEFQKYPHKVLVTKKQVIQGIVNNPQIEKIEFKGKLWLQNCGDTLRILEKTSQKRGTKYLWECEFIKYPFITLRTKEEIINGSVLNPLIEKNEFIGKCFKQNCGDFLKVIGKNKDSKYNCKFLNYPFKTISEKKAILDGEVENPNIRKRYLNTEWQQRCNDVFIIKNIIYNKKEGYLYKGYFKKYFYETTTTLKNIKSGSVFNYNLPYLSKEGLEGFIQKHFADKKVKLIDLFNKFKEEGFSLGVTYLGRKIDEFNLKSYIEYYPLSSNGENEVEEYINNILNVKSKKSNWSILKEKEIDIYIPNKNLGIEFDGNYWHSSLYKSPAYHQEKSLLAKEKGVKLLHIFEYEWEYKKNIVKALIQSKLGIFNQKIGARKCQIKELEYREYANFCNENHLQGEAGAKVKLGLYFNSNLIQVMSFSKPRFTDSFEWEIIRECSKIGCFVLGGKQKLWQYFLQKYKPKSVISYCDFSKFNGDSYLNLGFKKERLNKPGFVWYDIKTKQTYWRDPYKNQEMKAKGYSKIYDCGQLVFSWYSK